MKLVAAVLGLILAVIAVVYWITPAGSLPQFFPGFEIGSTRVHIKHGLVSAAAAIVLFGIAWFVGRSNRGTA